MKKVLIISLISNLLLFSIVFSAVNLTKEPVETVPCDGCSWQSKVFSPGAIQCIDGIKHRCGRRDDGTYYWGYLNTTCK